ncbi:MAG: hypothetical protein M0P71_00615 [Melioribacteraceae bacterium]|nr:hypothetical protein [Melioribacteraceae bacterium]
MHKKILLLFIVGLLTFGCSDDPSSVGANLISDGDKVAFDVLDSGEDQVKQTSNYYYTPQAFGSTSKVMVGATDEFTAYMLLKFDIYLEDSVIALIKNNGATVNKSWINFYPKYTAGNQNLKIALTAHEIEKSWALEFDLDSLNTLPYKSENVISNLTDSDTLLTCNLSLDLTKQWIDGVVNADDSKNNGVIFVPQGKTKIYGFNAISLFAASNPTMYNIEIERPGKWKDTLQITPYLDNHVIKGSKPNLDDRLIVQSGYIVKGKLFFDLSSLPKPSIINKAIIELSLDSLMTKDGTPSSDSLVIYSMKDSSTNALTSDSVYNLLLTKSGTKYTGDITWLIQKIIEGSEYQGFRLDLFDDSVAASRIVFYGSKYQDSAKRPRIKITYTRKQ